MGRQWPWASEVPAFRQEKQEGHQPADSADLGGRSPKRGEHCFFGSTVTGVSPASARWMCGPSSLSSTKRTDICSRPSMWGFLSSGAWDLGSQSRDCGKFLQYPKSKQVPAGAEGIIANNKKAAGCRQSWFGLDWLPRASPLQATWPSFLAPE